MNDSSVDCQSRSVTEPQREAKQFFDGVEMFSFSLLILAFGTADVRIFSEIRSKFAFLTLFRDFLYFSRARGLFFIFHG